MKENSRFEQQFHISELIEAEMRGELSSEQRGELDDWLASSEANKLFYEQLINNVYFQHELAIFSATDSEGLKLRVREKISAETGADQQQHMAATIPFYRSLYFRIITSAAIALLIIGLYLYKAPIHPRVSNEKRNYSAGQIAPGKNTATLTLAGGKTINLSEAKSGLVIDVSRIMYNDGTEINLSSDVERKDEILTVSTPRGGQYQVVLPDGSQVWLNAASSIQFPSSFANRKQRSIKLNGEAYFEISKDRAHPFIVESEGQRVEVLGTHFNISAYSDEGNIRTTLLEGSVKVSPSLTSSKTAQKNTNTTDIILKPNEQAVLTKEGLHVDAVVAEDEVAWKEGFFLFKRESLESVMYKISRWYNIEVIYDDPSLKKETILGTMSRYEQLSKVLNLLKRTGVATFEISGNAIHVKKQSGN